MLFYSLNQIYLHYAGALAFDSINTTEVDAVPPPPKEKASETFSLEDDICFSIFLNQP